MTVSNTLPHPLAPLSEAEILRARDTILKQHGASDSLYFRCIYLNEPAKAELVPFLELEHAGKLTESTPRPPRQARVEYDVLTPSKHHHIRTVVDLKASQVVSSDTAAQKAYPSYSPEEFNDFQDACVASELFQKAMSEFALPENFKVIIDPWPYGGPDDAEDPDRYMQGLVFAVDSSKKNPDSNHYGYPIPIIPVMDWVSKKIVRVDRLATGGAEDGLEPEAKAASPKKLFQNNAPAEYVPELLDIPLRNDLKPINITQPEGASFTVHPDGLIEWQKWRFRIVFTPREAAVLHDVTYENRPIVYRLSYSELTVPYGDPRPPFHRKQAFDFGDGGIGRAANNLELGCDCLGAIHYMDSILPSPDGTPTAAKSVVCLHEQDNGILWKHTNFRTNRAVVTRNREFVVQFIATLANYEYIFAYKFDLAGGITVETRATGIVSVVSIDEGKTSKYGNVVAPGILAQNHQHIFAVRIDPAIDSYTDTQVVVEESISKKIDPKTNPYGNYYEVQRQQVDKPRWIDAEPRLNRVLKLENSTKKNSISGKNVGYKFILPSTQMLVADDDSVHARRARYAQHNMWVTGYRDGEFWVAGEFTNQSRKETDGVDDMVRRGDWFTDEAPNGQDQESKGKKSTPVLWGIFGLTHNPRVEDWPVMPVEIHQMHLRPADFFTFNPALDVPSTKNAASVLVPCCSNGEASKATEQDKPLSHLQGSGKEIDAQAAGASVTNGKTE
ncbi:copper amine oxidase [Stachybotrys elegans]|uniref:Amine oxidase n=1 Tax=Stachybotrys elegans TaxID=80388 RepID=A0A8K0WR06_9HYPO|nr:copper amine oxidase [Stachybotrys elegans]